MTEKNILIFKTNINTLDDINTLKPVLDLHPQIERWSIDLEDDDRVLRVISKNMSYNHITDMIKMNGYQCEELKD